MRDILIAGGGPAGLAAGIRAAQCGLDAAIIEPKPTPIDKACGEGLMPIALAHLAGMGVGGLAGHPISGIRYVDAYDGSHAATADFERPGRGVRRLELHRQMSRRATRLGVERIDGRVVHLDQHPNHIAAAGLKARYLIAADGLHSRMRRQLGVRRPPRRPARFGVRRHLNCAPWSRHVEVYWGPRGEAYVTPIGAATVGVALLSPGGGRFGDLLDHFPALAARLCNVDAVTAARGGGPFEQRVQGRVVGRVLLVGDAAGYLDPLTGEGVALGVTTASAAVDAIAADRPDTYERRYRRITRTYYWLTGLLLSVSERRWLHRPMVALLDKAPGVFQAGLRLLGGR